MTLIGSPENIAARCFSTSAASRERDKEPHRLLVDEVLREIEEHVAEGEREFLEPIGVVLEAFSERHRGNHLAVRLERGESLDQRIVHNRFSLNPLAGSTNDPTL